MGNKDNIVVKPVKTCFKLGEDIEIDIENIELESGGNISINLSKVDKDYTTFAYGSGKVINSSGKTHRVRIINEDIKIGIYLITTVHVHKKPDKFPPKPPEVFTKEDFGDCLIEVINPSNTGRTEEELTQEYKKILQTRNEEFLKGIGTGSIYYRAFIFIKNCIITQQLRLGTYEIIPWEGLECNDEINLLQNFLTNINLNKLTNTSDTLKKCKNDQPTAIIHFPRINADNPENAFEFIENESQLLSNLLAVFRNSYPSIFGSLLINRTNGEMSYKLYNRPFTGNLMGGLISGEDPRYIKQSMSNLKNNEKLQLYIELYNEASKETKKEFLYFRLWNILEIIASSKGFKGQIKKDWNGNPGRDWNGNIIIKNDEKYITHKKEIVFELLRNIFNKGTISKDFNGLGIKQSLITELIPIWYQHRNCVVHDGGCFPKKTSCKKYCKEAYEEVKSALSDGYLSALDSTVTTVINYELNRK